MCQPGAGVAGLSRHALAGVVSLTVRPQTRVTFCPEGGTPSRRDRYGRKLGGPGLERLQDGLSHGQPLAHGQGPDPSPLGFRQPDKYRFYLGFWHVLSKLIMIITSVIILLIKLIIALHEYKPLKIYHLRGVFLPECTFCARILGGEFRAARCDLIVQPQMPPVALTSDAENRPSCAGNEVAGFRVFSEDFPAFHVCLPQIVSLESVRRRFACALSRWSFA